MSNEQSQQAPKDSQQSGADKGGDLIDEMRKFGQTLESLFTTAVNSERTRAFQQDIANGMREIGTQVQATVKKMQDNPKIQELEERGRQALRDARESQVLDKCQDTLVQGISQLNNQINKLVERLKDEQAPSPPPARSVPIDDDETPS